MSRDVGRNIRVVRREMSVGAYSQSYCALPWVQLHTSSNKVILCFRTMWVGQAKARSDAHGVYLGLSPRRMAYVTVQVLQTDRFGSRSKRYETPFSP